MRIHSLLVPAVLCAAVTRCAVNPATGRRELVSESRNRRQRVVGQVIR